MVKSIGFICLGAALLVSCSDDKNNNRIDAATPSSGGAKTFMVTLNRSGGPTPCGPTPGGTGNATVVVSPDNTMITVDVTYSGLSQATPLAGHIHFAADFSAGARRRMKIDVRLAALLELRHEVRERTEHAAALQMVRSRIDVRCVGAPWQRPRACGARRGGRSRRWSWGRRGGHGAA